MQHQKKRIAGGEKRVVLGDWADAMLKLDEAGKRPMPPAWVRGALAAAAADGG